MYFDDATMQDWAESAKDTQQCVGEFMSILGSPWALGKTQPVDVQGDFLGLIHDFTEVQSGTIRFWPRQVLIQKVTDIISLARQTGCPSGTAAKLYGISNFLETGTFARVGRAGLAAIKEGNMTLGPSAHRRSSHRSTLFVTSSGWNPGESTGLLRECSTGS